MLGPIRAVTTVVNDLGAMIAAYRRYLNYRLVDSGVVPLAMAQAWGAAACAGRPYVTLQPASGEPVYLRFIEDVDRLPFRALTTHGWAATEFTVQNSDRLSGQLVNSNFDMIGPPMGLTNYPTIRAAQFLGPAGECNYFTTIGTGTGLQLAPAKSFTGRIFIVVVAGPDHRALSQFYGSFGNELSEPRAVAVKCVNKMNGFPADQTCTLSLARLSEGTSIEIDGYPASTSARPCKPDDLPSGMAMVSFLGLPDQDSRVFNRETFNPFDAGAPTLLPGLGGQQAICGMGPAGERVEIILPSHG
jgi:hypothetical protein